MRLGLRDGVHHAVAWGRSSLVMLSSFLLLLVAFAPQPGLAILDEMLSVHLEDMAAVSNTPTAVIGCQTFSYVLDGTRLFVLDTSGSISLVAIRDMGTTGPSDLRGGACFGTDLIVFSDFQLYRVSHDSLVGEVHLLAFSEPIIDVQPALIAAAESSGIAGGIFGGLGGSGGSSSNSDDGRFLVLTDSTLYQVSVTGTVASLKAVQSLPTNARSTPGFRLAVTEGRAYVALQARIMVYRVLETSFTASENSVNIRFDTLIEQLPVGFAVLQHDPAETDVLYLLGQSTDSHSSYYDPDPGSVTPSAEDDVVVLTTFNVPRMSGLASTVETSLDFTAGSWPHPIAPDFSWEMASVHASSDAVVISVFGHPSLWVVALPSNLPTYPSYVFPFAMQSEFESVTADDDHFIRLASIVLYEAPAATYLFAVGIRKNGEISATIRARLLELYGSYSVLSAPFDTPTVGSENLGISSVVPAYLDVTEFPFWLTSPSPLPDPDNLLQAQEDLTTGLYIATVEFSYLAQTATNQLTSSASAVIPIHLAGGWQTYQTSTHTYTPLYPILTVLETPPGGPTPGDASVSTQRSQISLGVPTNVVVTIRNDGAADMIVSLERLPASSVSYAAWAAIVGGDSRYIDWTLVPGQSLSIQLAASPSATDSVGEVLVAGFKLTTSDPFRPQVDIWWAAEVVDKASLLVLSSSHPLSAPSRPQIMELDVEAGDFEQTRLTVVNTASVAANVTLELETPVPYWVVIEDTDGATSIHRELPGGGVAIFTVRFDYEIPYDPPYVVAPTTRRALAHTPSTNGQRARVLAENTQNVLESRLTVHFQANTEVRTEEAVMRMKLHPGDPGAPFSAFEYLSGGALVSDKQEAYPGVPGISRVIVLRVQVLQAVRLLITARDEFGFELDAATAGDALLVDGDGMNTTTTQRTGTSLFDVRVQPLRYSANPYLVQARIDGKHINGTLFAVHTVKVPCSAGYAPNDDGAVCVKCQRGYNSTSGVECGLCPAGYTSAAGQAECKACNPGEYELERVECDACSPGYYSPGAISAVCYECDRHYESLGRASTCTVCPAGTHRPTAAGDDPVTTEDGSTKEWYQCRPCEGNSIAAVGGTDCIPCPLGTEANFNKTICKPCPRGTFYEVTPSGGSCAPCPVGTYSVGGDTLLTCIDCEPGTYASSSGSKTCDACPIGTVASLGGASDCTQCSGSTYASADKKQCLPCGDEGTDCFSGLRKFLPNYWRAPQDGNPANVTASTIFHECDASACDTSEDGIVKCTSDHYGSVCSFCIDGYAKVNAGNCVKCPSKDVSVGLAALVLVVASAGICVMVRRADRKRSRTVGIIRIFINYAQANASMGSFSAKAPEYVRSMLGLASAANGISLDSVIVQCSVKVDFITQVWFYLTVPILAILIPLLVTGVIYLYKACCWAVNPSRPLNGSRLFSMAKTGAIIIVFLTYNKVAAMIFSAFHVYPKTIGGERYLKNDLHEKAYSSQHSILVAACCLALIVYVAGIPLSALRSIRKRQVRDQLQDDKFRRTLGFLYDGYHPNWCWWEGVVLARKVAIAALAVFVSDSFLQVYVASLLMTLALGAQLYVRPFEVVIMNRLETMGLVATFITQMGSILYWRYESLSSIVTVVLIGVNLIVVGAFVLAMTKSVKKAIFGGQPSEKELGGLNAQTEKSQGRPQEPDDKVKPHGGVSLRDDDSDGPAYPKKPVARTIANSPTGGYDFRSKPRFQDHPNNSSAGAGLFAAPTRRASEDMPGRRRSDVLGELAREEIEKQFASTYQGQSSVLNELVDPGRTSSVSLDPYASLTAGSDRLSDPPPPLVGDASASAAGGYPTGAGGNARLHGRSRSQDPPASHGRGGYEPSRSGAPRRSPSRSPGRSPARNSVSLPPSPSHQDLSAGRTSAHSAAPGRSPRITVPAPRSPGQMGHFADAGALAEEASRIRDSQRPRHYGQKIMHGGLGSPRLPPLTHVSSPIDSPLEPSPIDPPSTARSARSPPSRFGRRTSASSIRNATVERSFGTRGDEAGELGSHIAPVIRSDQEGRDDDLAAGVEGNNTPFSLSATSSKFEFAPTGDAGY